MSLFHMVEMPNYDSKWFSTTNCYGWTRLTATTKLQMVQTSASSVKKCLH